MAKKLHHVDVSWEGICGRGWSGVRCLQEGQPSQSIRSDTTAKKDHRPIASFLNTNPSMPSLHASSIVTPDIRPVYSSQPDRLGLKSPPAILEELCTQLFRVPLLVAFYTPLPIKSGSLPVNSVSRTMNRFSSLNFAPQSVPSSHRPSVIANTTTR